MATYNMQQVAALKAVNGTAARVLVARQAAHTAQCAHVAAQVRKRANGQPAFTRGARTRGAVAAAALAQVQAAQARLTAAQAAHRRTLRAAAKLGLPARQVPALARMQAQAGYVQAVCAPLY